MNRIGLILTLEPLIAPTATERDVLRKLLDKALVAATLTLPLHEARSLAKPLKDELEIVLRDILVATELKKLAKKWSRLANLTAECKMR